MTLVKIDNAAIAGRHPNVPLRRVSLSEVDWEQQIQKGLFTVVGGQRLAIPVDFYSNPHEYKGKQMWTQLEGDTVRPGTRLYQRGTRWQGRLLEWANTHIHKDFSYRYYLVTLGHDLHVSTYGNLYGQHWHTGWTDPFNPEKPTCALDVSKVQGWGFLERLGWLSGGKVTVAFISEEVSELVSSVGSEYADFDFHEVGTSNQAESNADTALITTSGISRVTGTPTNADPIYRSVGTITADATETWEEHGLFNNTTGAALMDRALTGGQSVNSSDQVQYTYEITKTKEA